MFQTIAAVLSCVNGRNAEGGEGLWDPMRGKTAKAAIAAFAPANQADNDNVNDNENDNENVNDNENENVNVGWPREARLPWGREVCAPPICLFCADMCFSPVSTKISLNFCKKL